MGSFFKWGSIAVGAIVAVSIGAFAINVITQPMRTASGIMNKTFDAENVITTYSRFHDLHAVYLGRVNQIKASAKQYENEKSDDEKRRLLMEVNAQKQSCRDIVTKYNADSTKLHTSIFKGMTAPQVLEISTCEG